MFAMVRSPCSSICMALSISSDSIEPEFSESPASPADVLIFACSRRAERIWSNRSEEHTSELQSLMRTSYAVFCLKKKKTKSSQLHITHDEYQFPSRIHTNQL